MFSFNHTVKSSLSLFISCVILFGSPLSQASDKPASGKIQNSCVLIDNDFDIDDMMAIPMIIGNKYVAAIIQSEGYTLPEHSAAAINELVNNIPDRPNQRKIPIIVGGKQSPSPDYSQWFWVDFFRTMMNQANALLNLGQQIRNM
jgi:hypothetical protein